MERLLLISALLLAPCHAWAQPAVSPKPAPKPTASPSPAEDPTVESLERVKHPYRPKLIRDPFSSPTDNADVNRLEYIDEIGVKGRVVMKGRPLALVLDSRGKTRMLPVGHRFKDGEIIAITDRAVIFRQWDPSAINQAQAKSVEKLFKREEGKR